MSIPSFIPKFPPDGSSLGQTKATIRNNLDGTFLTLGVDHINNNGQPGSQPAGYHNVAHFVPQGSDPAMVANYGQLYSKTVSPPVTPDQALFWVTGTGIVQQLTSNITPTPGTNGYTFIPGGMILQWGQVSPAVKNTSTPVSFNIDFPTANFTLQGTLSAGTTTSVITLSKVDKTKFNYYINSGSSQIISFFWWAIGN